MSRILLVEDDPLSVIVLRKILQKRGGYEVINTENTEEILELCKNREIDLVIMDISLSNSSYQGKHIDGIEITRQLKLNPKTQDIPVILATAHAMRGDAERFLKESNADDYISKPITDHKEFIDIVKSLLN